MRVLSAGRRRPAIVAVAAASLVGALALAGAATAQSDADATGNAPGIVTDSLAAQQPTGAGTYIVQLKDRPVASYEGELGGLSATKPKAGASIDPKAASVQAYRAHLKQQRAQVLDTVPGAERLYDYDTAFNGFAVKVDGDEAAKLAHHPEVLRLWKNEMYQVDTVSTPDFLELSGKRGAWERQFDGQENAGEGVIVGVVDTGIWPENAAFDALPTPRPDADVIEQKWNGSCDQGDDPDPENNIECNNKLIGAAYFGEGIDPVEEEFDSPRDYDGHGSHTASTAAGNTGVEAVINDEPVGEMSGMAPAARIAMYKACWAAEGGGCAGVDLVAAIDQAVADGVDVINYSISGSPDSIVDATEIAFYNAAQAGVFVAASAGNDGPATSTVNHNSPWVTTVAASSHDRGYEATVTLGDGTEIVGAGLGAAVPDTDLVLSSQAVADGATEEDAWRCAPGSLDEAKVQGKIVACARGVVARTDKSAAVEQAGGVGMIHVNVNTDENDIAADYHSVPTVHVTADNLEKIESYATTDGPTAALSAGERVEKRAPEMAPFSSSGPALAGEGDLLKPDVTAPGVDIIAAVAPPTAAGENFASLQGTSMSSPHVAGLGALLSGKHPDWQPSRIKSALMTTATTTDNEDEPIQRAGEDASVFDLGAGHVVPKEAFQPGLAYESGPEDWIGYICGIGQGELVDAPCDDVATIDPSDLNYPSIAIGALAGSQTVTRTVTNTSDKPGLYRAEVEAPAGTEVSVQPKALLLKPGQSKKFEVEITRTDAELGSYTAGSLTWKGLSGARKQEVTSPIVVRPVALDAPSEVRGSGPSGNSELSVAAGYDGSLEATAGGLVADTVTELPLKNPDGSSFPVDNPQTNDHVGKVNVTVPQGASAVRFATYDADYSELQGIDLDMFVYRKGQDGLELVGSSASGGSDESVTLAEPGDYEVYVDLWSLPGGASEAKVQHHHWVVQGDEGNLTVSPESQDVAMGDPTTVTAEWSGLEKGTRYLGVVGYGDGSEQLAATVLSVTG